MTDTPTELETHDAVEFLRGFDPNGRHNLVAMDPVDTNMVAGRTFEPGDFGGMFRFIDKWNGTRNLYFSVNEPREGAPNSKLSKSDIAFARAVHADFDPEAGADMAKARLDAVARLAAAHPSIVLDSGGGVQAFWKFAEKIPLGDPAWLENLNAAVRERFGGDPAVKNVDRVMRVPFTLNIPTGSKLKKHPGRKPRLAAVITEQGPTCDRAKIESVFPPVKSTRTPKSDQPLVELDRPGNIERAKVYLLGIAPEAVEGAGGDQKTYTVACVCRDYGLSEGMALELMLEHWNEQKASPPWQPEELATKVANAYQYASGGWGARTVDAEFEPIDLDDSALGEDQSDGSKTGVEANERFPEPVDLWASFDPPLLPRGHLPKLIEDFAFSQGELMGADPGGLAASALAVCAAAIPDRLQIRVMANSSGWRESARIWVALIGDPSVKKSPIMRRAVRPLRSLDQDLFKRYETQRRAYEALSKEERLLREEPRQKRLLLEDATMEAAQEVLKDSPDGLLCFQDELGGWFGTMDKYSGSKGGMKDRSFWLSAFNGDAYAVQRISRGSTNLPNLSVCMLGGIQPEAIRKLAADGIDDGLLQRVFPIVLRRGAIGLDRREDPSSQVYDDLLTLLRGASTHDDEDGIVDAEPELLRFSTEAQQVQRALMARHDELADVAAINPKLASHIGKYDGLFARLCVIWHAIEHADRGLPRTIEVGTADRVAKFLHDFLLPHALSFYAGVLGLSAAHDAVTAAAGHILAHPEKKKMAWRDLARGSNATKGLNADEGRRLLERLEGLGWLLPQGRVGNQTAPQWKVNPRVHELFAERARLERDRREKTRALMASLTAKAAA